MPIRDYLKFEDFVEDNLFIKSLMCNLHGVCVWLKPVHMHKQHLVLESGTDDR